MFCKQYLMFYKTYQAIIYKHDIQDDPMRKKEGLCVLQKLYYCQYLWFWALFTPSDIYFMLTRIATGNAQSRMVIPPPPSYKSPQPSFGHPVFSLQLGCCTILLKLYNITRNICMPVLDELSPKNVLNQQKKGWNKPKKVFWPDFGSAAFFQCMFRLGPSFFVVSNN